MLCIRLTDKSSHLISSSCRSTRLMYKSNLYRIIHTLFMAPFYLTGLSGENQVILLEMYTDFEDDQVRTLSYLTRFCSHYTHYTFYFSQTQSQIFILRFWIMIFKFTLLK